MFMQICSLDDIKSDSFIIENIRWDLMPKDLMNPVISLNEKGIDKKEHIKGYIFYIDTADDKPVLSLMRHTAAGYAETLAQIEEIPESLLLEAIEENKSQEYFMMYPINQKVREWLYNALGIESK
ncbi:MAG: hypothetical protein N2738_08300 [Thermodesulfovibrionales bacterium]|nr:hypothetical protein [Thermodesulfovibrionales bacterium]